MKKKNAAAQALAALRSKKLSPARRKQIASQAANKRWAAEAERKLAATKPK